MRQRHMVLACICTPDMLDSAQLIAGNTTFRPVGDLLEKKNRQLVCQILRGTMHGHMFSYFMLAIQLTVTAGKYRV